MSSNQPKRREIITLDEVPRSSTPEPAAKRPRTSRSSSRQSSRIPSVSRVSRATVDRAAVVDPYPQATHADLELDRAVVMDPYPQAIHSDLGLEQTAVVDPYPQATLSDAEPDRTAVMDPYPQAIHSVVVDPYPQATLSGVEQARAAVMDPYPQAIHSAVMDPYPQAMHLDPELDRSAATSAMETHVESPDESPVRAAVDGSRVNESTTRAADSLENPPVTSGTLPADVISTGVDSGVMPPAMLEQMAWDASVMLVSTESDANVMFIAMGAETTGQSRLSSSTGVGTDMHSSTLALQDDEAGSTSLGSGVAQPLANEDRLDIVRIGPPAQGDTRQRRDQPAVRWGQGIPIRPLTTTQSLPGSVPSRAATVPTNQSSATPAATTLSYAAPPDTTSRPILPLGIEIPTSSALVSVSDAIEPASCPAATLEPSVRAEAHEVVISRRAEAAVTVILVTTSKNRLNLEGQRFVLRGTLTAIYKCKKKAILASLSHLMRLDSLFSYMDDSNSKQLQINLTAVYMH